MVLIDPEAYHNFIGEDFAKKKELQMKGIEGFKVSNTNGKIILVNHIMEMFEVRLHSYMVREIFYIYPLKVHPIIILGVQWLFKLGDIHTNYYKLIMSFGSMERSIHYRGFVISIHKWTTNTWRLLNGA